MALFSNSILLHDLPQTHIVRIQRRREYKFVPDVLIDGPFLRHAGRGQVGLLLRGKRQRLVDKSLIINGAVEQFSQLDVDQASMETVQQIPLDTVGARQQVRQADGHLEGR